jgi:DNA topoisomerase-1
MAVHLNREELDHERVAAIALRLIDSGWFRVGSEQHARASGTYGITTLRKRHVSVRGHRVNLSFRGKHRIQTRSTLVDAELAAAIRELAATPGGSRLFRYVRDERRCNLTSRQLNDYVKLYLGPEFTAKDFRTWGARYGQRSNWRRIRSATAFHRVPPQSDDRSAQQCAESPRS